MHGLTLRAVASLATATISWAGLSGAGAAHAAAGAPERAAAANMRTDPYDPATGHPYRHGAVPTIRALAQMKGWAAAHPHASAAPASAQQTGAQTLSYGGGIDGIGVTSGKAKVYLIFWGSQWGTQQTGASGDLTFSNDPDGAAPVAQDLFKGIGTGGELWSATLTQWCDGPNVTAGALACPSNANFVPYMSGGVLSGAWYDNAAAEPQAATGNQLGAEALKAAHHFGNTTAAANRDAYYVVLSATGTDPDTYQESGFCAWHDYNGDTTLTGGAIASDVGDFAFSNQPYTIDAGAGCGVGFVNDPGTLDGWTMVMGHEFAETMSDQNPAGGWTNQQPASSYYQQENADECAWIWPGLPGGAGNVTMGNGTYAMQASWSNDDDQCDLSHPIVNHAESVSVTNPGYHTSTVNNAISAVQVTASDSATGKTLTYSASGLPTGLSINSSGLITGTPAKTGTWHVTVTATSGTASGSASATWAVVAPYTGILNGGFETGDFTGWTTTGTFSTSGQSRSGTYAAQLGDFVPTDGDSTAAQTFTVPAGKNVLSFFYEPSCSGSVGAEWATATLADNTARTTSTMLPKTCADAFTWSKAAAPVTAGHTYTLTLISHDDDYDLDPNSTTYDDVALSTAGPNPIVNGGFESGNLTGWTPSGAAAAVVGTAAHSGTYAARLGDTAPTNGASSITQTFTAATGDSTLTLWYSATCPQSFGLDGATVTLTDNTAGSTTTVLDGACPATPVWTPVWADLTAGHSYTVTLTSYDDNGISDSPAWTLYDDVVVN